MQLEQLHSWEWGEKVEHRLEQCSLTQEAHHTALTELNEVGRAALSAQTDTRGVSTSCEAA